MIIAPTTCFFLLKTDGETAGSVVSEFSPKTASDIVNLIFTSVDFDSDILATNSLQMVVDRIHGLASNHHGIKTTEKYNPLYIPSSNESIDAELDLDSRGDGIRFIGFNGNPFTLKTIELSADDEVLLTAKIDYRPFEFPSYNDLVDNINKAVVN